MTPRHLTREELEAGLPTIREAPKEAGRVEMVVRRPAVDAREVLVQAELDPAEGLKGDTWKTRGSRKTPDKSSHPDMQLTLIGVRAIALVAQGRERWPLAGDQLVVDLDLSAENLPAGTRLALGTARIEITDAPHTGCKKFANRFGWEALRFVNSPAGRPLRLRGVYARVIQAGVVRVGDEIRKLGDGCA